jgi:hypothetical protein
MHRFKDRKPAFLAAIAAFVVVTGMHFHWVKLD